MAATDTMTATAVPVSPALLTPLQTQSGSKAKPRTIIQENLLSIEKAAFDPAQHLEYTPPAKILSMEDLGYPESRGVSPIGVSEPFTLFSEEAVKQMRAEILSDVVWKDYQYSSELAQCQLRGYAAKCAPFIYDAWNSPEVLSIVSKIAGIDLVPAMELEIGHINISVINEEDRTKGLAAVAEKASRDADEGVAGCPWEDESPIVDWHTDSYPFVCVTMLSDCTTMVGGETALRRGDGEIVKVRGPQMGSAVVLQGRYIEHQALRAFGSAERITMVTSFRPKSSSVKDDTVLTTVRPISRLSDLYHQFAEYRFNILQDRFRDMNKFMESQKRARRGFDTKGVKSFIRDQVAFLQHMDNEMVDTDQIQPVAFEDTHLVPGDLKQRSKKRQRAG